MCNVFSRLVQFQANHKYVDFSIVNYNQLTSLIAALPIFISVFQCVPDIQSAVIALRLYQHRFMNAPSFDIC